MSEPEFPTSLGTSTADEIRLLGQSLTDDLMGKVGFGELAFWLVTLRRPSTCSWVRPIASKRRRCGPRSPSSSAIAIRTGVRGSPCLWTG